METAFNSIIAVSGGFDGIFKYNPVVPVRKP
jgi:hypothetical protein